VDERFYEEYKESMSKINKDIEQALENSLNKSHLTMEDNNKAQKMSSKRLSSND
jgi:hypothetical protein